MLLEFTVGNYRSFKEPMTFSMVAAKVVASKRHKDVDENNVIDSIKGRHFLKSAAIYGANSSGKSNLIKALQFMRRFVLRSSREGQADDLISVEPFALDDMTLREPSHFEVVFIHRGKQYRYGFEATSQRVTAEWLYHVPAAREVRLFEHRGDEFKLSDGFREGKDLGTKTRPNALFLSVVAQFNGATAIEVLRWFRELQILSGLEDTTRRDTERLLELTSGRERVAGFLRALDLGFDDILVEQYEAQIPEEQPVTVQMALGDRFTNADRLSVSEKKGDDGKYVVSRKIIKTVHRKGPSDETTPFNMDQQESEGTRKLFALAGLLLDTLDKGRTLVVDELDARLHPLLTQKIIELFNSRENNRHNAQLIFATHDTNLLTNRLFRRDQIWFVEKDRSQATQLYSLVEFKVKNAKVRNDASFEKDYINGRYGAIPFVGDLEGFIQGLQPGTEDKRDGEET
jgi:uncharacterized protein